MDDDTRARVRRLIDWIKIANKDMLDDNGRPSPARLAEVLGGKQSYWSDVVRIHDGNSTKSFGAKKAREVEAILEMPHLHLDGAGWPFLDVSAERFFRLSPHRRGRVEQALLDALKEIEAEQVASLPAAQPPTPAGKAPPVADFDAMRSKVRLKKIKPGASDPAQTPPAVAPRES